MAALMIRYRIKNVANSLLKTLQFHQECANEKVLSAGSTCELTQVRFAHQPYQKLVYTDWKMQQDVKKRAIAKEYAKLRLQLNAIKRNDILPQQLRDVASAEMHALPKASCPSVLKRRCVITSRPRGVVHRWRLSRIMWRHLADYNYLSGVQRAMW